MKPFSQRALTTQVSAIKRIAAEAKKETEVISLSQGIPSFSTPAYIRRGVAEALLSDEAGIGKYSLYMGTAELRAALANRLSRQWSRPVDETANLFVCSGGMQGLAATVLALIEKGDQVIVPTPNYGPHFQHIHLAGGEAVTVAMVEDKGWLLDVQSLEKAITAKTKLILFTNPGNPLGNVIDRVTLEQLAKVAKHYDLWVVVDETYEFLTYDDTIFVPAATIDDFAGRLVVVRTFSKEYAMTGWRLGYVYGPSQFIAQALKMHDPMVIAASTVSQKAGLIALRGDQQIVSKMAQELGRRRDLFCRLLDELKPEFQFVKPKGAYYVFARLAKDLLNQYGPSTEEFALRMLKQAKVAVVPGSEFKPAVDQYIRFSFAGKPEEFTEALKRIKKWLGKQ